MKEADLTSLENILYLLTINGNENGNGEGIMRGMIRTKEKCPICDSHFKHIQRIGFICPEHKTTPKKFYVDLFYQGKRIRLYSHKSGRVLDSYQIAQETINHVHYEMRNHTFDPSRYVISDIQKYYFECLINKWIAIREADGISTVYKYKQFNRDYFSYFKNTDIRDIRTGYIYEFYHQLKPSLSKKSKKNILTALHAFFNWLYKMEYIEKKPVFPNIPIDQPDWQWIDVDVQSKFLSAIPAADRDLYLFLALHGCRPSEGRAIKVKDIDFQHNSIHIKRTFSGKCGNILVEHTKTKKSRTIPVNSEMADILKVLCRNKLPDAFVFVNQRTGKPYSKTTYQKIWDAARKQTGINIKSYEGLRHSFASQRVSRGISIYLISKVLGHTSAKTTERYSHTNIDSLKHIMTVPRLSPAQILELKK